jgi:hypothetical protein
MKLRSGLLQITVIAALFAALAAAMPAGAAGTCYVNDDASGLNDFGQLRWDRRRHLHHPEHGHYEQHLRGAWDIGDNGMYTLALEANQVIDTAGNPLGATTLGSFRVRLNYTIYLPLVPR